MHLLTQSSKKLDTERRMLRKESAWDFMELHGHATTIFRIPFVRRSSTIFWERFFQLLGAAAGAELTEEVLSIGFRQLS